MNPQVGTAECVVCTEAITNPICPDCLALEARTWLADRSPRLADLIDPQAVTTAFTHSAGKCVICGKDMSICTHCYSRDMLGDIAQEDPALAAELAKLFEYR